MAEKIQFKKYVNKTNNHISKLQFLIECSEFRKKPLNYLSGAYLILYTPSLCMFDRHPKLQFLNEYSEFRKEQSTALWSWIRPINDLDIHLFGLLESTVQFSESPLEWSLKTPLETRWSCPFLTFLEVVERELLELPFVRNGVIGIGACAVGVTACSRQCY
ncbi:hypothetical protein C2G38_2047622 [Gigaspora rosea]|uniref:Uncharacterized protein n=1 Tax=Gigaspora rosea TaxID=44941 RepID=A0A397U5A0_9GLOM|nr:hypothetical protein C2G38_2047622 [Gigaspora rosea]